MMYPAIPLPRARGGGGGASPPTPPPAATVSAFSPSTAGGAVPEEQGKYAAPDTAAQIYCADAEDQVQRWSFDVNVGYGFEAVPDSEYACDMTTVEAEGAYYLAPHHALTLSLGFAGGGRTNDYCVAWGPFYVPFTDSFDRNNFTLMGGYRFSHMIGRYAILQVGAKAGLDVQSLRVDKGFGRHLDDCCSHGKSDTAAGLAYAGYAMIGFFVNENTCVHLGYQFRGATSKPSVSNPMPWGEDYKAHSMRWHEVRVGFTYHF